MNFLPIIKDTLHHTKVRIEGATDKEKRLLNVGLQPIAVNVANKFLNICISMWAKQRSALNRMPN